MIPRSDTPPSAHLAATHAIILAAGLGSRLNANEGHKLMVELGGRTMLAWHLANFARLGVQQVTVITGYEHEALTRAIATLPADQIPRGITLGTAHNPDFRTSNGISVLTGVDAVPDGIPFWLTMSDHLFDPALFDTLHHSFRPGPEVQGMLVVDRKLATIFDMPDATKVSLDPTSGRLRAIGKDLADFDLVDAGLFWCGTGFVQALRAEKAHRQDCSTSDAVRRLDALGQFAFWDLGPHLWQDVDTPGARAHATRLLANHWQLDT